MTSPRQRPPRMPDAQNLHEAALRYLERFAASAEMVRRVLQRRIDQAVRFALIEAEDGAALVTAELARLRTAGLIDDDSFARMKAGSLLRQGRSRRQIQEKLAARGIKTDQTQAALADLAQDLETEHPGELDRLAAIRLARKRRFGPWRPGPPDPARRQKELAALGRAGFAYDLASQILAGDAEELEAELRG